MITIAGSSPTITSEYDFNGIFKYLGYNLLVDKLIGDVVRLHIEKAPTGMSVKLLNASIFEDNELPTTSKAKTVSMVTTIVLSTCCLFSVLFVAVTILQHCRSKKGSVDLSEIV
uniref:SEA domain-containing protein n=1 Tax=Panagrellus redivivus TaxID=6233 RepID=A0A7E4ZX53_PANRE